MSVFGRVSLLAIGVQHVTASDSRDGTLNENLYAIRRQVNAANAGYPESDMHSFSDHRPYCGAQHVGDGGIILGSWCRQECPTGSTLVNNGGGALDLCLDENDLNAYIGDYLDGQYCDSYDSELNSAAGEQFGDCMKVHQACVDAAGSANESCTAAYDECVQRKQVNYCSNESLRFIKNLKNTYVAPVGANTVQCKTLFADANKGDKSILIEAEPKFSIEITYPPAHAWPFLTIEGTQEGVWIAGRFWAPTSGAAVLDLPDGKGEVHIRQPSTGYFDLWTDYECDGAIENCFTTLGSENINIESVNAAQSELLLVEELTRDHKKGAQICQKKHNGLSTFELLQYHDAQIKAAALKNEGNTIQDARNDRATNMTLMMMGFKTLYSFIVLRNGWETFNAWYVYTKAYFVSFIESMEQAVKVLKLHYLELVTLLERMQVEEGIIRTEIAGKQKELDDLEVQFQNNFAKYNAIQLALDEEYVVIGDLWESINHLCDPTSPNAKMCYSGPVQNIPRPAVHCGFECKTDQDKYANAFFSAGKDTQGAAIGPYKTGTQLNPSSITTETTNVQVRPYQTQPQISTLALLGSDDSDHSHGLGDVFGGINAAANNSAANNQGKAGSKLDLLINSLGDSPAETDGIDLESLGLSNTTPAVASTPAVTTAAVATSTAAAASTPAVTTAAVMTTAAVTSTAAEATTAAVTTSAVVMSTAADATTPTIATTAADPSTPTNSGNTISAAHADTPAIFVDPSYGSSKWTPSTAPEASEALDTRLVPFPYDDVSKDRHQCIEKPINNSVKSLAGSSITFSVPSLPNNASAFYSGSETRAGAYCDQPPNTKPDVMNQIEAGTATTQQAQGHYSLARFNKDAVLKTLEAQLITIKKLRDENEARWNFVDPNQTDAMQTFNTRTNLVVAAPAICSTDFKYESATTFFTKEYFERRTCTLRDEIWALEQRLYETQCGITDTRARIAATAQKIEVLRGPTMATSGSCNSGVADSPLNAASYSFSNGVSEMVQAAWTYSTWPETGEKGDNYMSTQIQNEICTHNKYIPGKSYGRFDAATSTLIEDVEYCVCTDIDDENDQGGQIKMWKNAVDLLDGLFTEWQAYYEERIEFRLSELALLRGVTNGLRECSDYTNNASRMYWKATCVREGDGLNIWAYDGQIGAGTTQANVPGMDLPGQQMPDEAAENAVMKKFPEAHSSWSNMFQLTLKEVGSFASLGTAKITTPQDFMGKFYYQDNVKECHARQQEMQINTIASDTCPPGDVAVRFPPNLVQNGKTFTCVSVHDVASEDVKLEDLSLTTVSNEVQLGSGDALRNLLVAMSIVTELGENSSPEMQSFHNQLLGQIKFIMQTELNFSNARNLLTVCLELILQYGNSLESRVRILELQVWNQRNAVFNFFPFYEQYADAFMCTESVEVVQQQEKIKALNGDLQAIMHQVQSLRKQRMRQSTQNQANINSAEQARDCSNSAMKQLQTFYGIDVVDNNGELIADYRLSENRQRSAILVAQANTQRAEPLHLANVKTFWASWGEKIMGVPYNQHAHQHNHAANGNVYTHNHEAGGWSTPAQKNAETLHMVLNEETNKVAWKTTHMFGTAHHGNFDDAHPRWYYQSNQQPMQKTDGTVINSGGDAGQAAIANGGTLQGPIYKSFEDEWLTQGLEKDNEAVGTGAQRPIESAKNRHGVMYSTAGGDATKYPEQFEDELVLLVLQGKQTELLDCNDEAECLSQRLTVAVTPPENANGQLPLKTLALEAVEDNKELAGEQLLEIFQAYDSVMEHSHYPIPQEYEFEHHHHSPAVDELHHHLINEDIECYANADCQDQGETRAEIRATLVCVYDGRQRRTTDPKGKCGMPFHGHHHTRSTKVYQCTKTFGPTYQNGSFQYFDADLLNANGDVAHTSAIDPKFPENYYYTKKTTGVFDRSEERHKVYECILQPRTNVWATTGKYRSSWFSRENPISQAMPKLVDDTRWHNLANAIQAVQLLADYSSFANTYMDSWNRYEALATQHTNLAISRHMNGAYKEGQEEKAKIQTNMEANINFIKGNYFMLQQWGNTSLVAFTNCLTHWFKLNQMLQASIANLAITQSALHSMDVVTSILRLDVTITAYASLTNTVESVRSVQDYNTVVMPMR